LKSSIRGLWLEYLLFWCT